MTGKQFETVLDIAEENVQLKRALKDVLSILDTYGNIEILLPMNERLRLAVAREIIAPKEKRPQSPRPLPPSKP